MPLTFLQRWQQKYVRRTDFYTSNTRHLPVKSIIQATAYIVHIRHLPVQVSEWYWFNFSFSLSRWVQVFLMSHYQVTKQYPVIISIIYTSLSWPSANTSYQTHHEHHWFYSQPIIKILCLVKFSNGLIIILWNLNISQDQTFLPAPVSTRSSSQSMISSSCDTSSQPSWTDSSDWMVCCRRESWFCLIVWMHHLTVTHHTCTEIRVSLKYI